MEVDEPVRLQARRLHAGGCAQPAHRQEWQPEGRHDEEDERVLQGEDIARHERGAVRVGHLSRSLLVETTGELAIEPGTVGAAMTRDVLCIAPDVCLEDAARLMIERCGCSSASSGVSRTCRRSTSTSEWSRVSWRSTPSRKT